MQRNALIDIAKGIGIILVVLGHLDTNGQISREFIYSFHMPLFFFLSGIFAKTNLNFRQYFKKSFLSLYLPYFIFVIIDTILFTAINLITHDSVKEYIKSNAMALVGFDFMPKNRVLWFLFALFVIRIVYYFISKNSVVKYIAAILCVGFVILVSCGIINPISNCLYLIAIPGMAFYILGSSVKKYIFKVYTLFENTNKYNILTIFVTILLFIILIFTSHKNGNIDMTYYIYGNALMYFVNALIGCLLTLSVSLLLSKIKRISNLLVFYGQNTMVVYIFHYYICRLALPIFMGFVGLSNYLYHPITQLVALIAVMLVMIPVIIVVNRYFYFIFGKSKNKH